MKIGQILKYKHNGQHDKCKLVVLHDHGKNERVLFNVDYGVMVGPVHALYADLTSDVASKEDILKYNKMLKID